MISKKTIEEVKKRLVRAYNPLAVYLFGSYAWGKPTDDSDLDLLIVVAKSDKKLHERSFIASDVLIDFVLAKDIIVYTKDEFEKKSKDITSLAYKIKKEGKELYSYAES
jgi:predicted nucleotidyltransferase